MKLAVMGAGAVGGYFGARLAAAGEEVHFVARGAQLETLVANGIRLKSAIQCRWHFATAFPLKPSHRC